MEELLSRVVLLLTVAALTTTTYSAEEYSIEGVVFAVSSAVGPRTVYIVSSIYELTTSSTTIEKRGTTWLLLTTYNIHSTRGEKEEEEEASWNGGRHRRTPLTTTQVSAAAAVVSVVCAVYIALESHAAAADGGRCLFRCSPFDALEKTKFALVCTSSSSIVVEVLQTHRPPLARLLHPSSRYLVCVVTKLHPMFLLCYSTNMLCHAIAQ